MEGRTQKHRELGNLISPPSSGYKNPRSVKMEEILSSETSVNSRSTQRHIPEDDILDFIVFTSPAAVVRDIFHIAIMCTEHYEALIYHHKCIIYFPYLSPIEL
jgi:hypothetical protein